MAKKKKRKKSRIERTLDKRRMKVRFEELQDWWERNSNWIIGIAIIIIILLLGNSLGFFAFAPEIPSDITQDETLDLEERQIVNNTFIDQSFQEYYTNNYNITNINDSSNFYSDNSTNITYYNFFGSNGTSVNQYSSIGEFPFPYYQLDSATKYLYSCPSGQYTFGNWVLLLESNDTNRFKDSHNFNNGSEGIIYNTLNNTSHFTIEQITTWELRPGNDYISQIAIVQNGSFIILNEIMFSGDNRDFWFNYHTNYLLEIGTEVYFRSSCENPSIQDFYFQLDIGFYQEN